MKQALLDYEVRVRFTWNLHPVSHPHIKSLTVDQGFFGGATFNFHAELNCFVGGQGTGKSTVIELQRYCFDDISPIAEIAQDTMSKISKLVRDGGTVTVHYLDVDGEEKIVQREVQPWETQSEVMTLDGNSSALLTKPVFFSQGELVRIAGSPIAQLDLIDRYINVDSCNSAEKQACEALTVNASKLQQWIAREQELEESIGASDTGLKATIAKCQVLEKHLKESILKDFPKLEAEKRFLDEMSEGLTSIQEAVAESVNAIDVDEYLPPPLASDSLNFKTLESASRIAASLKVEMQKIGTAFKKVLDSKAKEIADLAKLWKPIFDKAKGQHQKVLETVGAESVRKAEASLRSLSQRVDTLRAQEKELTTLKTRIRQGQDQRKQLRDRLRAARRTRFGQRKAKVAEWQELFQNKVTIDIEVCGDLDKLDQERRAAKSGGSVVAIIESEKLSSYGKFCWAVSLRPDFQRDFALSARGAYLFRATPQVSFADLRFHGIGNPFVTIVSEVPGSRDDDKIVLVVTLYPRSSKPILHDLTVMLDTRVDCL